MSNIKDNDNLFESNDFRVAAIIVTFNPNLCDLRKQINSISNFSSVFIIDNNSSNINLIETLSHDASKSISVIKLNCNMGLGYAQNKGITEALNNKFTHVILFDQDSFLSSHSFSKLLECEKSLLLKGIKVAAIGPRCIDPVSLTSYPVTVYFGPFIKRKFLDHLEICEASFIVASGSLIRMDAIRAIGLMRDEFFIDYIDVEWCYRAQSLGYRLFVTGESTLEHVIGDSRINFLGRSISMHSATRRYYLTRNCLRILTLSHIPVGYKLREVSLLFARILAFLYFSKERSRYIRLIGKSFKDALQGKFGKLQDDL